MIKIVSAISTPLFAFYELSEKLETYTVDYTDPGNPTPIKSLSYGDSITMYYGTFDNPTYITYTNILKDTDK